MPTPPSRPNPASAPTKSCILYWYVADEGTGQYIQKSKPLTWADLDSLACGAGGGVADQDLQTLFKVQTGEERYAFMCAGDALNMAAYVQLHDVFISVRNTGCQSVARLSEVDAGYACKGHDILGKSIKPKSLNKARTDLTGAIATLPTDKNARVRFTKTPSATSPWWSPGGNCSLPSAYDTWSAYSACGPLRSFLEQLTPPVAIVPKASGFVGWWVEIEIQIQDKAELTTLSVPIGILKVGPSPFAADPEKMPMVSAGTPCGVGVSFAQLASPTGPTTASGAPVDAYTGDYDLHCIFDPPTATAPADSATGDRKQGRVGTVLAHLATPLSGFKRLRQRVEPNPTWVWDSLGSLFQHGQQGSYDTFVLRQNYGLPALQQGPGYHHEKAVPSQLVPDADGVLAFCPDGGVHIMSSLPEVLAFYRANSLDGSTFTKGIACPSELEVRAALWPNVDRELKTALAQSNQGVACYATGLLASPGQPMVILDTTPTNPRWPAPMASNGLEVLFNGVFIETLPNSFVSGRNEWQAIASTFLYPPILNILCFELASGNTLSRANLPTAASGLRSVSLTGAPKKTMQQYSGLYGQANYPLTPNTNAIHCAPTSGQSEIQVLTWVVA